MARDNVYKYKLLWVNSALFIVQSFPKVFVHLWMTFCKYSSRISCQIIFVNKHWLQSCPNPFKWFNRNQIQTRPACSHDIYIYLMNCNWKCPWSCTSVSDFHSKNLQITSKLLTQGYRYHNLRNTFGKFYRSYSELPPKFGDISYQEYVSKGITLPKIIRMQPKSNLNCLFAWHYHIPNCNSKYQFVIEMR